VLNRVQKWIAVGVSICAMLGGLGGMVTGVQNASIFLCNRGKTWLGCPVVEAPAPPAGQGTVAVPPPLPSPAPAPTPPRQ
jgi:hypothetical protein